MDFIAADNSLLGRMAQQLVDAALSQYQSKADARKVANNAAKNAYNELVKKIDQRFKEEERKDITESENKITDIKYRQNGDGSYNVRVELQGGQVYVHTNKNLQVLRKLVKDRYLSRYQQVTPR